jgi:glutamate racemase
MQKKKEKKQEKKKYTKMVLTKHNKLKNITAFTVTKVVLGCTKFLF